MGEKWLPSFKFTFCSCFSTGLRPPNFPFRSRPPLPPSRHQPQCSPPPPNLFFACCPIHDPLHHLATCAHSRCLRSPTTLANNSSGHFLAWSHSVASAVIHLPLVAGETCHAEPTLPSLRRLPERQPAGPFGERSFVNPSKV